MPNRVTIRVRADDDTAGTFARIRQRIDRLGRTFSTRFRSIGRDSGNAFTTALNGSIGSALRIAATNPYILAGVATLVATLSGLLASALAGALTLAFGGAFVGLGVFLLAGREDVKKKWSKTFSEIGQEFRKAATPLLPVIEEARKRMSSMAFVFAPHFRKALEMSRPYLSRFLGDIQQGIEGFGEKAFHPMMAAFRSMLAVLGPEFQTFFEDLGTAFKGISQAVRRNREEVAMAFAFIFWIITRAVGFIAWLTNQWGMQVRLFRRGWAAAKAATLEAWEVIIKATFQAVHFISRTWTKLRSTGRATWNIIRNSARRNWNIIRSTVLIVFNKIRSTARAVAGAVRRIWRIISSSAKIAASSMAAGWRRTMGWIRKVINVLRTTWRWIRRLKGKVLRFQARGIQWVIDRVRTAVRWIRNLSGKVIHFGVSGLSKLRSLVPFLAHGGISTAQAGGARGRTTLVGEQGPELVNLAPGSRVRTAGDTRRKLASGGGGDMRPMFITLKIGNETLGKLIIDPLRDVIQTQGGNVQAVLGS